MNRKFLPDTYAFSICLYRPIDAYPAYLLAKAIVNDSYTSVSRSLTKQEANMVLNRSPCVSGIKPQDRAFLARMKMLDCLN